MTDQAETGTAKGDVTVVELTRAQQVVARRVAESRAIIPELAIGTDVDLGAWAEAAAGGGGVTLADGVVRAAALALRAIPRANGSYRDGRVELYSRVNVGLAVPAQDGVALPTIFDADALSLPEIAERRRVLSARAAEGTLTSPELSGGTFTVWDLGAEPVTHPAAVITPPQAAALAVGAVEERAVARDGAVVVRPVATLALSCDHRILYGSDAGAFLGRVRALLEAPAQLVG